LDRGATEVGAVEKEEEEEEEEQQQQQVKKFPIFYGT
jgi:hypothetical protein